jgi:uncharacterized protein
VQLIDGRPVYAATDLVGFLWCEHLTQLGRATLDGLVAKPVRDDPELELIRKRGFAHEKRYIAELESRGLSVTVIEPDSSETDHVARLRQSVDATFAAMRRGDEVIYQAAFFDGTWRGHADFLKRVDMPSGLGEWTYEVADTKLAHTAKAGALLQLCVYADLIRQVQGVLPPALEVALGGSARLVERFRTPEYMPFYERLRDRFLKAVDPVQPIAYPPATTYPEPVEHCDVCAWVVECLHRRQADDHLSLVAGISRNQRELLVERGVDTMTALSRLPLPVVPRLKGVSSAAIERVREQARLQVEGREQHKVLFELLKPIEAEHGLALLPPPSAGDLFFDMEGDPFVEEDGADGLEYLFGVIEPGDGLGLDPTFHAYWGLDRSEEKQAFESFIDLVMERQKRYPDLHVFHYGAYEPSAVKRLMGRHATREEEVDELLRAGVFVDLFRVIRQGVRVSQDSYSIKKLEALYGFQRVISLRDAGSSMVNFELWLEDQVNRHDLLDLIREYNRDDCVSNWRLRDWLEQRRASLEAAGTPVPRPGPRKGDAPPAVSEAQARVEALAARLTAGLPPAEERTNEQQATWLLAQLLDWFRREDKAYWWEYFHRLNDLTDDERIDDDGCIGGLVFQGIVGTVKRSEILRYTFPPQENDIGEGKNVIDPETGESPGSVHAIDQVAGILDLKRGVGRTDPHPRSLVPKDYYSNDDQRNALLNLGEWVADHGIEADGAFQAGRDLLLRRAPRAGQELGEPLRRPNEATLDAARRLALALQDSTLAVQGPPGTGKTFQGARMIVELVRAGKRVGVAATGHKVIGNLLDEVARAAAEEGVSVRIGQKPGREDDPTCSVAICYRDSEALLNALIARDIDVAGGTAWVWSDPEYANSLDVLFVDEAGQMSLANALAVAPAARSLVLLGDPQQLEQPRQGSHPPGAEASALQHLLSDAETIPDSLGLFLDRTWRMHPDLTRITSELFYEDRLAAEEITARQRLLGTDVLNGTGVRWIAVDHEGNENASVEEADVVNELVRSLLGTEWLDRFGNRRSLGWENMLVVAPYNAQVAKLLELLPEARIGTVDKFQGQEAVVAFYSLTSSSPDLAPRGMEFLYSRNRLNVATSRAQCLAVVVGSDRLLDPMVKTPRQVRLASALCRMWQVGTSRVPQGVAV